MVTSHEEGEMIHSLRCTANQTTLGLRCPQLEKTAKLNIVGDQD